MSRANYGSFRVTACMGCGDDAYVPTGTYGPALCFGCKVVPEELL